MSNKTNDILFMKEALKEANKAYLKNEVPVGAVLVINNKIVARAHNLVELSCDASCHAEMLCLKKGVQVLKNWRLLNTILYCTLEPCAMCAGALINHRVKKVVWGAPDLRQGAGGSWVDLFSEGHPIHHVEVCKGILEEESKGLMQAFFREQRAQKKGGA